MNAETFDALRREFTDKETGLLTFKRGEYANEVDVLKNFHDQAQFNDLTPETICMILAFKHIQGIKNMIDSRPAGSRGWYWEDGAKEGLKQRLADARNYLLLLASILEDQERIAGGGTKYPHEGMSHEDILLKIKDQEQQLIALSRGPRDPRDSFTLRGVPAKLVTDGLLEGPTPMTPDLSQVDTAMKVHTNDLSKPSRQG